MVKLSWLRTMAELSDEDRAKADLLTWLRMWLEPARVCTPVGVSCEAAGIWLLASVLWWLLLSLLCACYSDPISSATSVYIWHYTRA